MVIKMTESRSLSLIETIFAVLSVSVCLTGSKIVQISISDTLSFATPASAFCFVLTFFFSSLITHIAGPSEATKCVKNGAIGQIASSILFFLVGLMPAQNIEIQRSYSLILGSSWILVAASLTAFIVSQKVQIKLFDLLNSKTAQPGRSVLVSMLLSQIVDTLLFTVIAFGLGQSMLFSIEGLKLILNMFTTQYLVKIFVSILFSPVFSVVLHKVKVS